MPRERPAIRPVRLIVSCEHGGNRVPPRYRDLFSDELLASHRGYDPGALVLAREFAAAFSAELHYSTTTRLLVELNRSPGHRQLFSEPVRRLPREERAALQELFYRPYRERLEARIAGEVRRGRRVIHLSCHSFTPVLNGVERDADVGLLFDPRRSLEAAVCAAWQSSLSGLRVRRNYPYRGTSDGLTTSLRRCFDEQSYAGIELEVNQKFPLGNAPRWRALRRRLIESFSLPAELASHGSPRSANSVVLHRRQD
jgi:predicted N-formylglutamate amidohydrolase